MNERKEYDSLHHTVKILQERLTIQNQQAESIKEAAKTKSSVYINGKLLKLERSCERTMEFSKIVTSQFRKIEEDFNNKLINTEEYKKLLNPIYTFLITVRENINIHGFPVIEMVGQLKKAGY